MIAKSPNIDAIAHGEGGHEHKYPSRSEAITVWKVLKHNFVHNIPNTPEQIREWCEGVAAMAQSKSERLQATARKLQMEAMKFNLEIAKLEIDREMPKAVAPVNVAVFVKVIKGVDEEKV